jgi:hypothetical protein
VQHLLFQLFSKNPSLCHRQIRRIVRCSGCGRNIRGLNADSRISCYTLRRKSCNNSGLQIGARSSSINRGFMTIPAHR